MTSITIANLDDRLEAGLRRQAASHGRTVEEEALTILQGALAKQTKQAENDCKPQSRQDAGSQQPVPAQENIALIIRNIFADIGGLQPGELELPSRGSVREPPHFK